MSLLVKCRIVWTLLDFVMSMQVPPVVLSFTLMPTSKESVVETLMGLPSPMNMHTTGRLMATTSVPFAEPLTRFTTGTGSAHTVPACGQHLTLSSWN